MATGIDFGTTNSVIAQWNGSEAEPISLDGDNLNADWFYPSFENLFPSTAAALRGLSWADGRSRRMRGSRAG